MKDINSGNAGIKDGDIDDRDESTGGVIRTDENTREARTRNVYQKKNVNHIGARHDILIDEGSKDEFKLVGKSRHNVSYDTTDSNTIMFHPSIN